MSDGEPRRTGLLRGRRVFLSASVPTREGFRRPSFAALEIEEAVISFARTVLREEGVLVFGAHPSISPLVASVAGEYVTPHLRNDEPPDVEEIGQPKRTGPAVVIYQSHAYDGYVPDKTWHMYRLGYADLVWCAAQSGETFNPARKQVQCPDSLRFMRQKMFQKESPIAMVAIGGMEGVFDEAGLFLQDATERKIQILPPVYVLESTGGAAEILARPDMQTRYNVRNVEREWQRAAPGAVPDLARRADPRADAFVPYPLIMQWLAQQIAEQPMRDG